MYTFTGDRIPHVYPGPDGIVLESAAQRQTVSKSDRVYSLGPGVHSSLRHRLSEPLGSSHRHCRCCTCSEWSVLHTGD